MTKLKKVYKIKNGLETSEMKECRPRELPLSSKYIEKWWFDAIRCVYEYEKQRGLVGRHLMFSDDRISSGLKLYREKHITEITITTENGGDVLGYVTSEDETDKYVVVIKNFSPISPTNFAYQRETFISNLQISCSCSDHMLSRYRENASLCCKHISSIFWMLQEPRWHMPKIFITPEERIVGIAKSDTTEIETEIRAMPLVKFTQFINVLQLNKFRGMEPALGLSVHRISNEDHSELGKPQWLTYTSTELSEIERLLRGCVKVYKEILLSQQVESSVITEKIDKLVERPQIEKKKRFWFFLQRKS